MTRPTAVRVVVGAFRFIEGGRCQSAECLSYHITYKPNPVPLSLYSSPDGRYHHPLNPLNLLNPLNPHAAGVSVGAAPSTLTPKACPKSYHIISPSTSWPSRGRVLVNCQSRAPGWLQVLPHWAHQRGVSFGREGRWIFSSSQEQLL